MCYVFVKQYVPICDRGVESVRCEQLSWRGCRTLYNLAHEALYHFAMWNNCQNGIQGKRKESMRMARKEETREKEIEKQIERIERASSDNDNGYIQHWRVAAPLKKHRKTYNIISSVRIILRLMGKYKHNTHTHSRIKVYMLDRVKVRREKTSHIVWTLCCRMLRCFVMFSSQCVSGIPLTHAHAHAQETTFFIQ